jgi:hypothetical protein
MPAARLNKALADLKKANEDNSPPIPVPAPPPAREEVTIPDIKDLIQDRKKRALFALLVAKDYRWQQQESEAKKERKLISPKIKAMAGEFQIGKAQVDEYRINYYTVPREDLAMPIPEAKVYLMECGLKPSQIGKLFGVKDQHTLRISKPKSAATDLEDDD